MRGDAPVGFVVDRIDRLVAIAADQLEQDDAGAGTIDPALLDGIIKGAEGESTIKLLSPSRLLGGQFVRLGVSSTPAASQTLLAKGSSVASAGESSGLAVELLSSASRNMRCRLIECGRSFRCRIMSRNCLVRKPLCWGW